MKELKSKNITFRSFLIEDAPFVYEFFQEKEMAYNMFHIPYPYKKGMAEEWIKTHPNCAENQDYHFALVLEETNQLIGAIEIEVDPKNQKGYLGYWIGKPYWGKGYATEAVARIIEFGFTELQLQRIYAEYFSYNIASGRVMEKNGMQPEGVLRQHFLKWGKFADVHVNGILREEWQKRLPDREV